MFARTALLALCSAAIAAVSVSASPVVVRDAPITLSVARRLNMTGVPSILALDQARAKQLKARTTKTTGASFKKTAAAFDVVATNGAVDYTASVGVGTPPTFYDLLIDTGSSNTWLGADKSYVTTSSSVNTSQEFVRCVYVSSHCIRCSHDEWCIGSHLWFW